MKLGRRNLIYSIMLAGIMLLFLVGYFIYMLPSLYVDHVMEENLRSVREQHKSYVEKRSYKDIQVKNATACYSVEIPKEGDYILIAGKAFSAKVIMRDERMARILERCRESLGFAETAGEDVGAQAGLELRKEMEELGKILGEALEEDRFLPVEVQVHVDGNLEGMFFGESFGYHYYSDGTIIIEAGVWDENNHYTNYIVLGETEESMVMTYLPVVTPQMDEIRPVVLQSLPMLGAVILLAVLLFSQVYSRGIVTPVVELVEHTEEMKTARQFSAGSLSEKWSGRKDELRVLADTLDDFYEKMKNSYQALEEENRRQEVFLRASSHQLKTPIAAALLLVDGMIGRVGRYRNREKYLPEVKRQLLSMRKMVEEILYLNRCTENMQFVQVGLGRLMEEIAGAYEVVLADRGISVDFEMEDGLAAETDEAVTAQILDNLMSNAVKYTPLGGRIMISGKRGGAGGGIRTEVRIENFGIRIREELLPHIMEPFVSGSHDRGSGEGHGLGLYIASYYAKKLGACLSVDNGADSVRAVLLFADTGRE